MAESLENCIEWLRHMHQENLAVYAPTVTRSWYTDCADRMEEALAFQQAAKFVCAHVVAEHIPGLVQRSYFEEFQKLVAELDPPKRLDPASVDQDKWHSIVEIDGREYGLHPDLSVDHNDRFLIPKNVSAAAIYARQLWEQFMAGDITFNEMKDLYANKYVE